MRKITLMLLAVLILAGTTGCATFVCEQEYSGPYLRKNNFSYQAQLEEYRKERFAKAILEKDAPYIAGQLTGLVVALAGMFIGGYIAYNYSKHYVGEHLAMLFSMPVGAIIGLLPGGIILTLAELHNKKDEDF